VTGKIEGAISSLLSLEVIKKIATEIMKLYQNRKNNNSKK